MNYPENKPIDDFISRAVREEVIEPDLPIVDAHHHLWDIRSFDYDPYASKEQKVFLCDEFSRDINDSGHNVTQTVFAQCFVYFRGDGPEEMRCVGETEFVHGIAAMSRSGLYGNTRLCTGIVGSADLEGPNIESVLQAHLAASVNFRGVRTPFPEDLNSNFMAGLGTLAKMGLTYDNWSPDFLRLPTLAKLAQAHPDLTIVVNHLGGKIDPDADKATFEIWRAGIEAVANCPNTVMKLGGAQMHVLDWFPDYHMRNRDLPMSSEEFCERLYPHYQVALEAFGPERCMFESNFPVDRSCIPYRTLWNLFKRIANKAGMSEQEKTSLFSGTATRVYRL